MTPPLFGICYCPFPSVSLTIYFSTDCAPPLAPFPLFLLLTILEILHIFCHTTYKQSSDLNFHFFLVSSGGLLYSHARQLTLLLCTILAITHSTSCSCSQECMRSHLIRLHICDISCNATGQDYHATYLSPTSTDADVCMYSYC